MSDDDEIERMRREHKKRLAKQDRQAQRQAAEARKLLRRKGGKGKK